MRLIALIKSTRSHTSGQGAIEFWKYFLKRVIKHVSSIHSPIGPARNPTYGSRKVYNEIISSFAKIVKRRGDLNIYERIEVADAYYLYRLLLGRKPFEHEYQKFLSLNATFIEFLSTILSSPEYSAVTRFFPSNYEFMAELTDFKFYFNTSDTEMGAQIAIDKYEKDQTDLIKKVVRPGMKCIDAGAQTGYYTLLLSKLVGPGGKVYAFEPNPKTFRLLERNVKVNGLDEIASLYNIGLSDAAGELFFCEVNSMYVVAPEDRPEAVRVKVTNADKVIEGGVDFIKLDIEGCEPTAIKGMTNIIGNYRPIIHSEVNEYWLRTNADMTGNEYIQFVRGLGYHVYDVRDFAKQRFEPLKKIDLGKLDTIDVLCVSSDTPAQNVLTA